MGCKQSKAADAAAPAPTGSAPAPSPKSKKKSPKKSPKAKAASPKTKSRKKGHPAALYHHLLGGLNAPGGVVQATTPAFWEEAQKLCASQPTLASYVDPSTHGTPLHVACSLGASQVNSRSVGGMAMLCVEALADAFPAAVGHRDKNGHVPLEGVFAGMGAGKDKSGRGAFHFRTEAAKLLLGLDSKAVSLRGSVLYQIVEALPDDFDEPLGPSVDFVKVLVEQGGASASSLPSLPNAAKGAAEPADDDALALLYRRFVRQFDQSERFFAGDNSRPEVVRHRQHFKNAAVNTFNVIELLLRPQGGAEELLVHNAVRAAACPPDLLRYIVETNLEAVAEKDRRGNLPLHYAAGYDDAKNAASTASESPPAKLRTPESYSKYVIDELLYAYPQGASVPNGDGALPIVLAIDSGKKWIGGGIRSLHEAYPDGIAQAQLGEDHPLATALSLLSQDDASVDQSILAGDQTDQEGTIATGVDGGGGRRRKRRQRQKIRKDESHDAIMLVQRPGAPLRDVVTTMWANEEDGGVQMLGCATLGKAATAAGPSADAVASVALLGVATVVNAMKNHPNEPAVQERACAALAALAPADGRREVSFAASGAISTVVSAMQAHVNDGTVQTEACRALRAIAAAGGAERATVVASVSGFTALINAMGAHASDVGVQREACAALEVLTSFEDAYLPELHEQTESLLQAAADNFPEECADRTAAIRSRLNAANDG
ncbi:hypothetical protein ACHAXT_008175 [Thalassiosira profunda]